jgi:hypothetical protein
MNLPTESKTAVQAGKTLRLGLSRLEVYGVVGLAR